MNNKKIFLLLFILVIAVIGANVYKNMAESVYLGGVLSKIKPAKVFTPVLTAEVDGSTTNELQTISSGSESPTLTLSSGIITSNSGGTIIFAK